MSNGELGKIKKIDLFSTPIRIGNHVGNMYILPTYICYLTKPTAGNQVFTITLYKPQQSASQRTLNFRLYTSNRYGAPTAHAISGFIDVVGAFSGDLQRDAAISCVGCISNPRLITHGGATYMAVDVLVNQFGAVNIMLQGIHSDIAEIKDVTGNFTVL